MITTPPSTSFEATLQGAPASLGVGLGRTIKDGLGATVQARSTANIVEQAPGVYTATQTSPATEGTYQFIWDDTTTFVEEDLEVTYTATVDAPIITVADLGDLLNEDLTGDEAAAFAVDGASSFVRTFTEQYLTLVADDEIVLDGTGSDTLLLPERPVTEVSSVTENDTALTVDVDYKLGDDGILIRLPTLVENGSVSYVSHAWTAGRQNIEVTYSHGYAPDVFPDILRSVALSFAKRMRTNITQGATAEESLGAYSIRYVTTNANSDGADLTNVERAILRKFKMAK